MSFLPLAPRPSDRSKWARAAAGAAALVLLAVAPAQQEAWIPVRRVTAEFEHHLAYDAARERVVMFGGRNAIGEFVRETWEWTGTAFSRHPTRSAPPAAVAMEYDARRHCVLCFDGVELWEYDGLDWVRMSPQIPSGISVVGGCALVHDAAAGRTSLLTSTAVWSLDESGWTRVDPAHQPPGIGPAVHVDAHGVVLMRWLRQTWEWNGSDWRQRTTTVFPGPFIALVADGTRNEVLGFSEFGLEAHNGVWRWTGSDWQRVDAAPVPHWFTENRRVVFDRSSDRAFYVGGYGQLGASAPLEVWSWDRASSWTSLGRVSPLRVVPETVVSTRDAAGTVLAWAGGGIYRWDADAWQIVTWFPGSERSGPALAWDSVRSRLVVFGGTPSGQPPGGGGGGGGNVSGSSGAPPLHDTWEWDGAHWSVAPAGSMHPPQAGPMAFEVRSQRTVLVDGSDTWAWDGAEWRQVATLGPRGATWRSVAADPVRGVLVLHGGDSAQETWEWDGVRWDLRGTGGPSPRIVPLLVYDSVRARIVLLGGSHPLTFEPLADSWEWNGSRWSMAAALPEARPGIGAFRDPRTGRFVLLTMSTTWFRGRLPTVRVMDANCAASDGSAHIHCDEPWFGNRDFAVQVTGPAQSLVVLGVGDRIHGRAFGNGCRVPLAGEVGWWCSITNASGGASFALPIPDSPALRGAALYAQGLMASSRLPRGYTLTDGLALRIGD